MQKMTQAEIDQIVRDFRAGVYDDLGPDFDAAREADALAADDPEGNYGYTA